MALPDYFSRSATAAAQVIAGFDAEAIAARLDARPLAIALGAECDYGEGRALADLVVRLLARLYPRLAIHGGGTGEELQALARAINPKIEFVTDADLAIVIGAADSEAETVIYAGSNGWDALVSTHGPRTVGVSNNPFGAGAAACIAAANVFRAVFLDEPALDDELVFSTLELRRAPSVDQPDVDVDIGDDNALVGVGAIGNGVVWALARVSALGHLTLIDPEEIELSNLQRYVLATPADIGAAKVEVAARLFTGGLTAEPRRIPWDEFAIERKHHIERALVALDSARDRVAVQATLPRWLANAWTQPGDLGVSTHPNFVDGACLACLYLPTGTEKNEDKLIAEALGLGPEYELQVRELLHTGQAASEEFLDAVAQALDLPADDLASFRDRPLRELYVEGICGGALLPLDRVGSPRQEVHVPLAHQSALAGVLLATRLVVAALGRRPVATEVTRLNVLQPVSEFPTQLAAKDPRGICICDDDVYVDAWRLKYETAT